MTRTHKPRCNVLAAAASGIREQVCRNGGDPDEVLFKADISSAALDNIRNKVDLRAYVDLMEGAAQHTGNDNFGLQYGQVFRPEMLGLIGLIALSSPNLRAAIENLARYFSFHQQMTQTRLEARRGVLALHYRILDGSILDRRQDAELTLGMFANIFRHSLGPRWTPEEVHFEHPRPAGWVDHERAFCAPVHFGQRTNAIIFRGGDLAARMPEANAARLARTTFEITTLLDPPEDLTLVDAVRSEVRSCLADGAGTIDDVACALDISKSKLQRELSREGCSFSELFEDVRRQLAGLYLAQPGVALTDIAFLLGYSELSAFTRAFSRWHGMPPSRWRGERTS